MTEGSLDVKLPTIRTDGKPEVGRVRDEMRREEKRRGAERRGEERRGEERKRREETRREETEQNREDQRRERVRRKKMQVREKVEKSGSTMFFQWFVAPGGSKSRLAKAAGAEPSGQMRDEKLHAVVARSTFRSQNVQNVSCSDHFWKLGCRKSARGCGAKIPVCILQRSCAH